MDPLGEVYTGRDNTGAAAVFGRSPNELGQYYKQQMAQQAAAQKQDKLPEFDPDKDPMLAALGKAHLNDIPSLTKDYNDIVKLKVAYTKEKDPIKKGEILQQYLPAKTQLWGYIAKSLRTVEEEQKANTLANKDYKHTLPSDFEDRKKQWLSQDIHDRPESFDYGTLNVMSLADNAYKMAIAKMKPSVTEVVTVTPDGKKVTNKTTAISDKDAERSFSDYWDAGMPQNEKNGWTDLVFAAAIPTDGSEPDPVAVEALKKGPQGVKDFAIQFMMVNAHKKLGSGLYKVEPIKPSGNGDGGNTMEFKGGSMNTVEVQNQDGTVEKKTTLMPKDKAKDLPVMNFDNGKNGVIKGRAMYISQVDGADPTLYIQKTIKKGLNLIDTIIPIPFNSINRSQIDKVTLTPNSYDIHMKKPVGKKFKEKNFEPQKKSVSSPKTTTNYKTLKF